MMTVEHLAAWGQEMRAVHRRLRDALDVAREGIERGTAWESLVPNDLRLFCGGFCDLLTRHHSAEDSTLFPLVLRDRPDLAPTVAKLVQDHNMIAHLIQDLDRALKSDRNPEDLLEHLDGIEAVMETHFRFEERQLVELLDATNVEDFDGAALFGSIA